MLIKILDIRNINQLKEVIMYPNNKSYVTSKDVRKFLVNEIVYIIFVTSR